MMAVEVIKPQKTCPFCGKPVRRQPLEGGVMGLFCTNDECGAVFSFRGRASAWQAIEQFDRRVIDASGLDIAEAMANAMHKIWCSWKVFEDDQTIPESVLLTALNSGIRLYGKGNENGSEKV